MKHFTTLPTQIHCWDLPLWQERLAFGVVSNLILLWYALPSLWLSTQADPILSQLPLWQSYLEQPGLIVLNLLPCYLIYWSITLLFGSPWAGYLVSCLATMTVTYVNYFKIAFRGDPLLLSDLNLISEAVNITGYYDIEFSNGVVFLLIFGALGLVSTLVFLPSHVGEYLPRATTVSSGLSVAVVSLVLYSTLYANTYLYQATTPSFNINNRSGVQLYLSRGLWYPFLHSGSSQVTRQAGEDSDLDVVALLAEMEGDVDYHATTTPVGEISLVTVMLEAFCDYTQFEPLANVPEVEAVYAPWRNLQREGLHGNLLTNIFGGGTVNSEWSFVTGMPQIVDFNQPTQSYVWYFREQGYQTVGSHPGTQTFYDRNIVNQNLGYQDYWFSENYYQDFVDVDQSFWNSDDVLVDGILVQLEEALAQGDPVFSFSVSIQNHGPYSVAEDMSDPYVPASTGLSEESRGILQTYLNSISKTMTQLTRLQEELDAMDEPVILTLFGDHKPWGGNNHSVYLDLGTTFDTSTLEGFYDYYSTPYVIWANAAARELLPNLETGEGGDMSPHFLLNRIFQMCNWTQPPEMRLSSEIMAQVPVIHSASPFLYVVDGQLETSVPYGLYTQLEDYYAVHYYRKTIPHVME